MERPNHRIVEAAISEDIERQEVWRQTTVTFAPAEALAADGPGRDAALWCLARTLEAREQLTVGYHLQGQSGGLVSLGLRHAARRGTSPGFMSREKALIRVARMTLPGFVRSTQPIFPFVWLLPLVPGRIDVADAIRAASVTRPSPHLRACKSVFLPKRPLAGMDISAALMAMTSLDIPCALTLTLTPFALDAAGLRSLAEVEDSLNAVSLQTNGSNSRQLDSLSNALALWRATPRGIHIHAAFLADCRANLGHGSLIAELLFGSRELGGSTCTAPGLAESIPEGAVFPALTPRPACFASDGPFGVQRPPNPAEHGIILGKDLRGRTVAIARGDLSRHAYVIGATGTGKSTLLARMILQDIAANQPVFLIDPHGDLFAEVCDALPRKHAERAMIADVANLANPFTLNLLAVDQEPAAVHRNFIANQLLAVFKGVLYEGVPEAFGPMFDAYWRNALLLLMEAQGPDASLVDFDRVFGEPAFRADLLSRCNDESVKRFWKTTAVRAGGEASLDNIAPYIVSKLTQFTGNAVLRPIISGRDSSLDLPKALAERRSVLCNLAKGIVGGPDAALIGGLITIRLFAAAMARSRLPVQARTTVRVYMDEFQTYATGVLGQMLAESRKFGLSLVLANQSLAQVEGRGADIAHAVLANAGSILAFRVGPGDANRLAEWIGPSVDASVLRGLPDRRLIARIMRDGTPCAPTFVSTEETLGVG